MARADKKKNVAKVAEMLVNNPHATEREIAGSTGMSNGTAHNCKNELKQNGAKDDTIAYIVLSAKNRLRKVSAVFDRFVDESCAKDVLNRSDASLIKEIARDDMARINVLGGSITDSKGGISPLNSDQAAALDALRSL